MRTTLIAGWIAAAFILVGTAAGPSRADAPEGPGRVPASLEPSRICPYLQSQTGGSTCPYGGSIGRSACPSLKERSDGCPSLEKGRNSAREVRNV